MSQYSKIFLIGFCATFFTVSFFLFAGNINAWVFGGPLPTSITLESDNNPSDFGFEVTFTANVTGAGPTGTVVFKDNGIEIGSADLLAGEASFLTNSLAISTHSITAEYSGDPANLPSVSDPLEQTVNVVMKDTQTYLVSDNNPADIGNAVHFTATVSFGDATGSIYLYDGLDLLSTTSISFDLITATTDATFDIFSLSEGEHGITAQYLGDSNYNASISDVLTQIIVVPDTTAPVIFDIDDISIITTDQSGSVVEFSIPTAIDDTDGPVDVLCDYNSGDHFDVGTTTVTCTASDSPGNCAEKSFDIVVNYQEPEPSPSSGGGGFPYYVINSSAAENGSIIPAGALSLQQGTSQTFDITPDQGYEITDVLVDNVSQGPIQVYTFSNILTSHTISAEFFLIPAPASIPAPVSEPAPAPVLASVETSVALQEPVIQEHTDIQPEPVKVSVPVLSYNQSQPKEVEQENANENPSEQINILENPSPTNPNPFLASFSSAVVPYFWWILFLLIVLLIIYIIYRLSRRKDKKQ